MKNPKEVKRELIKKINKGTKKVFITREEAIIFVTLIDLQNEKVRCINAFPG